MLLNREIIQHEHFFEIKEKRVFRGKEINRSYLHIKRQEKEICICDIDHDAKELFIYSKKYADEIKAIFNDYKTPEWCFAVGSPI